MRRLDRLLGGVLVMTAGGIGATARTFNVGFLVDPLGPQALPYLVAGLFMVGGVVILLFPDNGEPSADEEAMDEGAVSEEAVGEDVLCEKAVDGEVKLTKVSPRAWRLQSLSLLILLGYASALPILGFVLSTSLATGALSRLFSGRFRSGFGVGMALGLGLFGLFTLAFGMKLPVGVLLGGDL
jgi:putative tricarboxylic transport membrane protein